MSNRVLEGIGQCCKSIWFCVVGELKVHQDGQDALGQRVVVMAMVLRLHVVALVHVGQDVEFGARSEAVV